MTSKSIVGTTALAGAAGSITRSPITPPVIPIAPSVPIGPIGPPPAAPRPTPAPAAIAPPGNPWIAVAAPNGLLSPHRGNRITNGGQSLCHSLLVGGLRLLGCRVRAGCNRHGRAQQKRNADCPGRNNS